LKESDEISHQIENYFKKYENFTMCVYYNDKHHGVNSIFMSFYNSNSIDIENISIVQIAIKYSILGIFFKIEIGVETRIDDLCFFSWAQIQKI